MSIQLLTIIILIFSVIIHEYAHGWVAHKLGDNTAKNEGRLTLNPLAHIDPFGTIILPLLLLISNFNFLIGWAKPVPYNPYNLSDHKYGDLKVAIGGPIVNLFIAIFAGAISRLIPLDTSLKYSLVNNYLSGDHSSLLSLVSQNLATSAYLMLTIFCLLNLLLMIFNMIPVPPLDGSKVLKPLLPLNLQIKLSQIEPYGLLVIILFLYLGLFGFIWPLMMSLFSFIIGL